MPTLPRLTSFLRNLFDKQRNDQALDDEVHSYIELLTEENMRKGMKPDEARRAARIELGGVEQVKESVRDVRAGAWLDSLLQDLRYGLRMLRKNPGFTAIAVLTLALGIGANTAIFSVVRAVIFRPLPFPSADRLAVVLELNPDIPSRTSAGLRDFLSWQAHNRTFENLAGVIPYGGGVLKGEGEPESIFTQQVTWEFFNVLGAPSELGRVFTAEDDRPDAPPVAVVSHKFWQEHYRGDSSILGRQVTLNQAKYTIIGVMHSGFGLPDEEADFWTPLAADRSHVQGQEFFFTLVCIGRLKPGVSVRQAQADLETVSPDLGPKRTTKYYLKVSSLREDAAGESRAVLLVLFGAVGAVLLIACANISNLLSMRAMNRRREFAVREALGAGRWRLTRQLLVESIMLSALGGAAGLLLASWVVRVLVASVPESLGLPNVAGIKIDGAVLLFTFVASLLTGILFGIAPSLHFNRASSPDSLKASSGGYAGSVQGGKLRSSLVVGEIAVSLALLAGAGLLLRTLFEMERVNLGFKPDHVLTVPVDTASGDAGPVPIIRALDHIRTLPGVRAAGSVTSIPLTGAAAAGPVYLFGQRPTKPSELVMAKVWRISAGYLNTMGIPLLAGRDFNEGDRPNSPLVALVNQSLVRQFFPHGDFLGKRIELAGFSNPAYVLEIVGVTVDTKSYELTADPEPQIFLDNAQGPLGFGVLVILTESDPEAMAAAMRKEIRAASPTLLPGVPHPMNFYLASALARPRFSAILFTSFAALAMLLAAVGIFGVMAYSVSNRTREIGIRIALGARSHDVLRLVIRQSMSLVLLGVIIGVAGAVAGGRLLRSLLFGVSAADPSTYVGAAVLLTIVALIACYIPARRAMRVDPMFALRHE